MIKVNGNAGTISGPSAGSGIYMALLSAFYSDCALPSNLAITGCLETEKKELPNDNEPIPKKYQWRADRCTQCKKRSQIYHFIYNKDTHKLEQTINNATNPNTQ